MLPKWLYGDCGSCNMHTQQSKKMGTSNNTGPAAIGDESIWSNEMSRLELYQAAKLATQHLSFRILDVDAYFPVWRRDLTGSWPLDQSFEEDFQDGRRLDVTNVRFLLKSGHRDFYSEPISYSYDYCTRTA